MANSHGNQFASIETTCGSLLYELQKIWDEVGEPAVKRDTMLLEIEQECLEVYRRKVEKAEKQKAELQQAIALSEAEIAGICSAMGEQPVQFDQKTGGSLREGLQTIIPQIGEMRRRKEERKNQFVEVIDQLRSISNEIYGHTEDSLYKADLDETSLSVNKLEQLQRELQMLQKEKSQRLKQLLDNMNSLNALCMVLGMDFPLTIREIHPTLDGSQGTKDITDNTIKRLVGAIQSLREVKLQRMQRFQELATALLELWNLMDTPIEEQHMFQNVTSKIAASECEITEANMLSVDLLNYVEKEVLRLEELKSSKMKEFVLKRRLELEEICKSTHMATEGLRSTKYSIEVIESGAVDLVHLLEEIELQIAKVKEESFSRKDILEKLEKWLAACEEECWLEEYNMDENRYNAGRGAHLALKRAEKARAMVNKILSMVEALISKVRAWEKERGTDFLYDGECLLSRLEHYSSLRQEKEQERQKKRGQRRLQVQQIAEQEALFGSKPSPTKSGKKASRTSTGVAINRKLSLGGVMLQKSQVEKAASHGDLNNKKGDYLNQNCALNHHYHSGSAVNSSGRRNSEIAGRLVKKHSSTASKANEITSSLVRKPLSPVSSIVSSNVNMANCLAYQNGMQTEKLQATLSGAVMNMATPSKSIFVGDQENRTPKTMPIPVPTTPPTVSAPMLMASTPATPSVCSGAKTVKKIGEKHEYSFEELRAGFI